MKKQHNMLLLQPKYWPSWLIVGLFFIIIWLLPYAILKRLGLWLSNHLERLFSYRMVVVKKNLQACFPNDWQNIYKKHKKAIGKGFFEMAMGWFLPKRYFKTNIRHEGFEYVESLLNKKGVMLLGMHTTSLDYGAQFISAHLPVHFVYKPSRNAVFDWVIKRARASNGCEPIPQDNMRQILKCLADKKCVWYGCDQDFGFASKSVFTPFFGIEALTLPLYAKIAKKADAYVVPIAGFWDDETEEFVVRYLPSIDVTTMTDAQAAEAMNRALEELIKGFESQYYWVHRRFKNRPEGKEAFYPSKKSKK